MVKPLVPSGLIRKYAKVELTANIQDRLASVVLYLLAITLKPPDSVVFTHADTDKLPVMSRPVCEASDIKRPSLLALKFAALSAPPPWPVEVVIVPFSPRSLLLAVSSAHVPSSESFHLPCALSNSAIKAAPKTFSSLSYRSFSRLLTVCLITLSPYLGRFFYPILL